MTVAGVDKQVVLAAGQENSKELKRLIQKGVNLEATYKEEGFASARTALIHACVEKRYENVKLLLKANVDVNKGNPMGKTALMVASQMNDMTLMNVLLEADADVNAKNEDAFTALHFSAIANSCDAARLLIEKQADLNAGTVEQVTPLMLAATYDRADVLKLLLNNNVKVKARDERYWSALHFGVRANSVAIVKILKEAGCDVNGKTEDNRTPLMLASGSTEMTQLLLDLGARVKDKDSKGHTALHLACHKNALVVVKLLVKAGADIHGKSRNGRTPLMIASLADALEVADWLISNRARVEDVDNDKWTALHCAAGKNAFQVAGLLMRNGADPSAKHYYGGTPYRVAKNNKSDAVLALLPSDPEEVKVEVKQHGYIYGFLSGAWGYMSGMFSRSNSTGERYASEGAEEVKATPYDENTAYSFDAKSSSKEELSRSASQSGMSRQSSLSQISNSSVGSSDMRELFRQNSSVSLSSEISSLSRNNSLVFENPAFSPKACPPSVPEECETGPTNPIKPSHPREMV